MIFADHLRRLLASGGRGRPLRSSGHPRGALRDGAPSSAVDPLGGNDLSCVVHVHSTFSDGHATVEEMLADARAAGAGALLLTDHDSLEARRQGWEGRHDGVLLLVGHEISPRGGHLLAFGLEREIDHRGRGQRELTRAVAAAGGIGFAAHPFSDGGHMLWPALARRIVRPHGWEALEDPALTGIELWSFLTDAAEHWSTPRQALRWIRDAERLVDARPAGHVANWDRLATQRRIPAIGGLDAHHAGVRLRGRVRAPLPNRRMFALLRTHLVCERRLTGTSTTAKPSSRLFARARRSSPARTAVTSKAPASGPSSTPRSCEWDARPAPDLASFGLSCRGPPTCCLRSDGSVILARSDVTSVTHPIEAAGLQTRGASWRAPLASQQPDLPVGSGFRR